MQIKLLEGNGGFTENGCAKGSLVKILVLETKLCFWNNGCEEGDF